MKTNGVLHKVTEDDLSLPDPELHNQLHVVTSSDTLLRSDAFELSDEEKIKIITGHFKDIMNVLGLDIDDDSLKDTPARVAKMYVKEIFSGLDPKNKPTATLFDNKYSYKQMLVEKNISLYSTCEHHFVPIIGKAHVAYISAGKVIGLSKINRIVQYYSKRPQVQERLTMQIANELCSVLGTENVAVIIDAAHLCVSARGIKDVNSGTVTVEYRGVFSDTGRREEFLKYLD
jgi:GTP cyclohydrolase I